LDHAPDAAEARQMGLDETKTHAPPRIRHTHHGTVPDARRWGVRESHYRPPLDGMRAVAVYLVVAFHAGISAFSGGFG
ncbi:MAG: hypothetical protein QOG50_2734, partial [Actinomycetota bacterium]|nr:hypothetical protein [Actinomycetota bacterium]